MKQILAKLAIVAGLFGLLASTGVRAADPLGLYAGAGAGQAHLRIDDIPYEPSFDETHTGWTAFVGLKPLPFLGAELQYLDFGHATKNDSNRGNIDSTRARALALFGTGTVSLPFVDLYAKAGVGRLQTTTTILYFQANACLDTGVCYYGPHTDRTDARVGGGLGAQLKLSSLGIRAEYVRFRGINGDPDLLSVALLWKF